MHQERAFLDVAVQGVVDLVFCRLSFAHDYGKTTIGRIHGCFDGNLVSADSDVYPILGPLVKKKGWPS